MAKQINAKEAYDAGVKAKHQGFVRVTPYYQQPRSDYWWLAGFDGVEFFEAEREQPSTADESVANGTYRVIAEGAISLTDNSASLVSDDGKKLEDFCLEGDVCVFVDESGEPLEPPYEGRGLLCIQEKQTQ